MKISIGIDTGGTYTDAIAFDYDEGKVLSKAKTQTTKEDLTICISKALESVPIEILKQSEALCLSTTLATNACVESKGIHSKLIIVGIPQEVLSRVDAQKKYGLDPNDVLCIDANGSFDGSRIDEPDWQKLYDENENWFADAQALCISEVNALRNKAVVEKRGRDFFKGILNIPVTIATDLARELNVMERGATALLNSRLVPLITDFIDAVRSTLDRMGVDIPVMIVRSDGTLMNTTVARDNPVQTILSGPAASIMGGKALDKHKDCLIIDIGGTTTDISIVEDDTPAVTDTICIGGWATQVKGVFIDTFGLGGDSIMRFDERLLKIGTRRVVPICVAATSFPEIIEPLSELAAKKKRSTYPDHEFLYIVREPQSLDGFSDGEKRVLDILAKGPVMVGSEGFPKFEVKTDRLEDQGVIMRCGMTPTDFMHLTGDFDLFDKSASELVARHFAFNVFDLKRNQDPTEFFKPLCDYAYKVIEKRLYECIASALLRYRYPNAYTKDSEQYFDKIVEDHWNNVINGDSKKIANAVLDINGALIGIGAPTHVFLPKVAEKLGVECVIPQDAEVANAIGCAVAEVAARVEVAITPNVTGMLAGVFRIELPDGAIAADDLEEAEEIAKAKAEEIACKQARDRGAQGELAIKTDIRRREQLDANGITVLIESRIVAIASGRMV